MSTLITVAVIAFYVLGFVVDRIAGVIYVLLALMSLGMIAIGRSVAGRSFMQFAKRHWIINLAMIAPLLAALAHLAYEGHFDGKTIDLPSRFAIFVLAFWGLQSVSYRQLKHAQWAFLSATIFAAIKMHVLTEGGKIRYGIDFIPIIVFAGITLLLGFFSLYSPAWDTVKPKVAVAGKVLVAGAALYAVYISGSRAPWMTIFVLIAIGCIGANEIRLKYRLGIVVGAVALALVVAHFSGMVQERVALVKSDIQQYSKGVNVDTSLGVRFQIWRGSWTLFRESPAFGVGVYDYEPALKRLAERQVISPYTATFPHSHNEVLFMMARFGILGLIAILALYLVPLFCFIKAFKNEDREMRNMAIMGIGLCTGIMTLGLTDVLFLWWEIPPFYALSVALFLTCIEKRKKNMCERIRVRKQ